MNDDASPSLSTGVLFALLIVAFLGFDFLDMPRIAANTCGASGYWTILAAFFLALPLIFLATAMQHRFPNQNLFQVARLVIGKPLAYSGNLVFLAIFFGWLVFSIRDAVDLVLTYLLNQTPLWAVLVLFLLGIGYVAVNGLTAVTRMACFVMIPTIGFRLIIGLLALQGLAITHILPVFSADPIAYLRGGMKLFYHFLPLGTVFLIYPLLGKPKKLRSVALLATGGAAFIFLLSTFGTIGIFGETFTQYFIWVKLEAVNHINIPFLVLEQVGLLFLIIWLTMFLVAGSFYIYVVADGLKQQFPILNYPWVVLGILITAGTGGLVFSNSIKLYQSFSAFRQWSILPVIVYPALVYLVALVRGIGRNRDVA